MKAKLIPEAEANKVRGCNLSVHQITVFIFMLNTINLVSIVIGPPALKA